jgi:hypothetical protein
MAFRGRGFAGTLDPRAPRTRLPSIAAVAARGFADRFPGVLGAASTFDLLSPRTPGYLPLAAAAAPAAWPAPDRAALLVSPGRRARGWPFINLGGYPLPVFVDWSQGHPAHAEACRGSGKRMVAGGAGARKVDRARSSTHPRNAIPQECRAATVARGTSTNGG